MKTFVRLSFIAISTFGLNSFSMAHENLIKGIRCFQDGRPFGEALKEVALKLNSRDKYNVTLRIAITDRRGATTDKTSVLAEDLGCIFSIEDPRISDCLKPGVGNRSSSGFSTTFTTIVGSFSKTKSVNIFVYSPFLKKNAGSMLSGNEVRDNMYRTIINLGGEYSKCEVLQ